MITLEISTLILLFILFDLALDCLLFGIRFLLRSRGQMGYGLLAYGVSFALFTLAIIFHKAWILILATTLAVLTFALMRIRVAIVNRRAVANEQEDYDDDNDKYIDNE